MTKEELITKYNKQMGNIVPNVSSSIVDICSLMDVIDNSRSFSFKVSLLPVEMLDGLLDYTDSTFTETLDAVENQLSDKLRWIAFYPKYNITFEKNMHVPVLNLNAITASDEVKEVFQIPIQVNFYVVFNNNINTIKRYYNSNLYFDHTGYGLIPLCISNEYNFNDLFTQTADATTPFTDASIWTYGIDFTNMNNFTFVIDDMDIYALTKNIAFIEIILNSNISNFIFFMIMKNGNDVYLKKNKISKLNYRKVFYNVDFINIKNRIIKYSE